MAAPTMMPPLNAFEVMTGDCSFLQSGRSHAGSTYPADMRDSAVKALSRIHAMTYRLSGGRVGTRLVDNDMLLLTSRGAETGRPHTVPLLYLSDGEDLIVIASYGGRPDHPQWYRNLVQHPSASVHIGREVRQVSAHTMSRADRETWWPRIVDAYAGYEAYQSRTDRIIPVVRLAPQ